MKINNTSSGTTSRSSANVADAWQAYVSACLEDAPEDLRVKLVKDWAFAYRRWRENRLKPRRP